MSLKEYNKICIYIVSAYWLRKHERSMVDNGYRLMSLNTQWTPRISLQELGISLLHVNNFFFYLTFLGQLCKIHLNQLMDS